MSSSVLSTDSDIILSTSETIKEDNSVNEAVNSELKDGKLAPSTPSKYARLLPFSRMRSKNDAKTNLKSLDNQSNAVRSRISRKFSSASGSSVECKQASSVGKVKCPKSSSSKGDFIQPLDDPSTTEEEKAHPKQRNRLEWFRKLMSCASSVNEDDPLATDSDMKTKITIRRVESVRSESDMGLESCPKKNVIIHTPRPREFEFVEGGDELLMRSPRCASSPPLNYLAPSPMIKSSVKRDHSSIDFMQDSMPLQEYRERFSQIQFSTKCNQLSAELKRIRENAEKLEQRFKDINLLVEKVCASFDDDDFSKKLDDGEEHEKDKEESKEMKQDADLKEGDFLEDSIAEDALEPLTESTGTHLEEVPELKPIEEEITKDPSEVAEKEDFYPDNFTGENSAADAVTDTMNSASQLNDVTTQPFENFLKEVFSFENHGSRGDLVELIEHMLQNHKNILAEETERLIHLRSQPTGSAEMPSCAEETVTNLEEPTERDDVADLETGEPSIENNTCTTL